MNSTKDSRLLTFIGLHVAVFLAGATGLFGRLLTLSGVPLVWARMVVSTSLLLLILLFFGKLTFPQKGGILPALLTGFLLAFHWVAFFMGVQYANVSVGVVCIATSGFFTSIFDPILNHHRMRKTDFFVSLLSILGILMIFTLDLRYRTGIILGLSSAALYSVFAICNVKVARRWAFDTPRLLLLEMAGGLLILTLILPLWGLQGGVDHIFPTSGEWLWILVLGSVLTIIPFLLQIHALSKLSAFTVNVTYNLEPIYSILLAAVFFGEMREVNLSFFLGLFLVILSVLLQTIRSRKSE